MTGTGPRRVSTPGEPAGRRALRAAQQAGFAVVGERVDQLQGHVCHELAHPDGRRLEVVVAAYSSALVCARPVNRDRWPGRPRSVATVPTLTRLLDPDGSTA